MEDQGGVHQIHQWTHMFCTPYERLVNAQLKFCPYWAR